jgi:formiminoglutamate deiminase
VSRIWCERAWRGRGPKVDSRVLIEAADDGTIASVETGVEAPADAAVLPGYSLPGLANTHSHAFQRAIRGRTEAAELGSFWTWREKMYEAAMGLDPDLYRELARATFAEMALAGITAVGEFHYVHHDRDGTPYADPNEMGRAVIDAAREAGVRITLIDACYLRGGATIALEGAQRRFADASVESWTRRVEELVAEFTGEGEVRIGGAIHSVRAVDAESARAVASWAAGHGAPLHAHVSEQPRENEECLAETGWTPSAQLAEAGALGGLFTAVHATHLTDADRDLLGSAGATVCLCPTTERDLADGIGGAASLRDAGAHLAVGSDSQAVIDLFEEARAIELDERLGSGERGRHAPAALLVAAGAAGHAAIGRPEGGAIEVGAPADLVHLDPASVRLAGIDDTDPLGAIAFAATASDVADVFVGGRQVVRDGAHTSIEVATELRSSIAALGEAGR